MQHRPWRRTPFQVTTLIAVALMMLILFVSVGYFFTLPQPGTSPAHTGQAATFNASRDLWNSRRPAVYTYVVERSCFCAPDYRRPYRVRESDTGRAAVFESPLEATADDGMAEPPEPVWIDDLFTLIEQGLNKADEVRVSYDPAFGFPTSVMIDWSYQAADEEHRLLVRDFEVIEYRN